MTVIRYVKSTAAVVSSVMIMASYCTDALALNKEARTRGMDKKVVDLVNRARSRVVNCGGTYYGPARPVAWNETLGQASLRHSLHMASSRRLFHTSDYSAGRTDRFSIPGYNWQAYGENVGEGYRSPEEVVKGWLRSPDHCKNIMNPVFEDAGSSYALTSGRIYWTLILAEPEKRQSPDSGRPR
jgi:uncharacterized protein YkwD